MSEQQQVEATEETSIDETIVNEQPEILISMIMPGDVQNVWLQVYEHLEAAVEYSTGRYDMQSLLYDMLSGRQTLWIAFRKDTKEIIGAATTKVMVYPGMKALFVQFLGGKDFKNWYKELDGIFCSFAKDNGCSRIESVSRKGMINHMTKAGFEETATFFEKRIE